MKQLRVRVGRGAVFPGTVDLTPAHDNELEGFIRQGIAFSSASLLSIEVEGLLERLTRPQALVFLRECRRVLAPEGRLSASLPAAAGGWTDDHDEVVRLAAFAGLALRERPRPDPAVVEFGPARSRVRSPAEEPLVSILIPSHNPRHFRESLESALRQTYRNLEIVLSDNTDGNEIERIVLDYMDRDPRIRYHRSPQAPSMHANFIAVFELARGEYLKYLCDDDVLHPSCVQRMVRVLNADPAVALVTSHRQVIDDAGNFLPDLAGTRRIVQQDSVIDGTLAGDLMITHQANFIGEPSTTMFRRADAAGLHPNLLCIDGFQGRFAFDVVMWLNLLSRGDLVYLVDSLSYFRSHAEQGQQQPEIAEGIHTEWSHIREHATRMGYQTRGAPPYLPTRPLEGTRAGAPAAMDPAEFHPEASPLDVGDTKAVRLLCIPDWGDAGWQRVLVSYLRAFGPEDPVSLLLRVEPPEPALVARALAAAEALLAEAGLPEERTPDIVFEASVLAPGQRGGLYTAASALLPVAGQRAARFAREAQACGLPLMLATSPERLRAAVGELLGGDSASLPSEPLAPLLP